MLRLHAPEADCPDVPASPCSPSASIAAGVPAIRNSGPVARLTLRSVACADSMTATRSWYGESHPSSVAGFGLAARSRSKSPGSRQRRAPAQLCGVPSSEARAQRLLRRACSRAQSRGARRSAAGIHRALRSPRSARLGRRPGAHMDAIDRAEREAEFAAGAIGCDDGVHALARADDRIGRAVIEAARAADAGWLVDPGDQRRAFAPACRDRAAAAAGRAAPRARRSLRRRRAGSD